MGSQLNWKARIEQDRKTRLEIFIKLERGNWEAHISVEADWFASVDASTLADLQEKIAAECAKMGLR